MVCALLGGLVFSVLNINLGLGDLKITFQDLLAAFLGSLLLIVALRLARLFMGKKKAK